MKKLRLHLEDLRIDSFDTTAPQKPKGTVFGEQCTCHTQCTCPGCPTCYASCDGTCNCSGATCDVSCNGTCDACGTWDLSCGGNTCDYTCPGYATIPPPGSGPDRECMLC